MHRDAYGNIAIRHWNTDIVTHRADGWTVVDMGGWDTVTTRARVNAALPGPFGIGSNGNRGTFLFSRGYAILPYVGGIAVNATTGCVGIRDGVSIAALYSAEDIAEVIAAEDVKRAERDARRAARILREHPVATVWNADVHPAVYMSYSQPRAAGHRGRGYGAVYGCAACEAEAESWREARAVALGRVHADGYTMTTRNGADTADVVYTFPAHTGAAYYGGSGISCPWDCPARTDGRY
jgi:hypothetical protein